MNIVMIAEKPSVARTYVEALDLASPKKEEGYYEGKSKWDGNYYYVTWSRGHLVTMSYPQVYDPKYEKWNFADLPFLPSKYKYEVIKENGAAKQFKVVKSLYHKADIDQIIYAGDSGREGLYIQCLIRDLAGNNGHVTEKVLWIDSQTTAEIRKGLNELKPLSSYNAYKDAGYMRAIEDFAFGINYSRMFTLKFGREFNQTIGNTDKPKSISIGRVMTCVLAMVVEREREIKNFVPTSFYKVFANCSNGSIEFSADWLIDSESKYYDSPDLYNNKGFLKLDKANDFIAELSQNPTLVVDKVEDKTERKKAPLLYNLAELQNECSKRFKIDPNKTLEVVQKLYEAKLTTYPRTDARYLSTAICVEIEDNLKGLQKMGYNKQFVDQILSSGAYKGLEKTGYCDDSKITDHYAIFPTGGGDASGLDDLELNIYQMIVDRFICIFLPQAEYNVSTAILKAHNGERFKISEKVLVEKGYLEVLQGKVEEDEELGDEKLSDFIKKGDSYSGEFLSDEGKTTPPKRYTSGSMILAMENAGNLIEDEELRAQIKGSGIGTSATRAAILEKLVKIEHIKINKKTQVITPGAIGEAVYDIVKRVIPEFLSPKMTASWEKGLSQIEDGKTTREYYQQILDAEIRKTYDKLKDIVTQEGSDYAPFESVDLGVKCPFCDGTFVTARKGVKCSNYKYKDDNACKVYISRNMSKDELETLVANGTAGPFEFTKSDKSGTFSAFLKVDNEAKSIVYDFPDSNGKNSDFKSEDTGLKCPFCGKEVVTTPKGYKCKGYRYNDKKACGFCLSELGGVKFGFDHVKELIEYGSIGPFEFTKKSGAGTYNAKMVLDKKTKGTKLDFSG